MRCSSVGRRAGRGAARGGRASGGVAVGAAAVLFGTSGIATQLLAPGLPALTAAGWRIVLGAAALLVLCTLRGAAPWKYPLRWRTVLPGSLAFLGFQLGFFLAIGRVGVATATVVAIGTGPVVAGLLDRLRRGRPLRLRWWVGIAVAAAGVAVMTGAVLDAGVVGVGVVGAGVADALGWASAIAAGCCLPLFGDAIREVSADRPPVTAVATVFCGAVPPAGLLLAIAGTDPLASPGVTAALLYLGVVTTAVAYALWTAGLAVLTLSDTVTLTMVEPIAATLLAVAILHEPAGPNTAVGIVVTLVGVWVATATSATVTSAEAGRDGPATRRPDRGPVSPSVPSPTAGWPPPSSR